MNTEQDLRTERSGAVATMTLLGEHRLSSMRRSAWEAMRVALEELDSDPSVRAIVLTGEGPRAFCAGGEIQGYKELADAAQRRDYIDDCMRTFAAIEQSSKPVVAAVRGVALGGGFELLLTCDAVVAGHGSRFGMPETTLGLMPGFGVSRILDHLGAGWARYLVLSGETIDAAQAERLGIVQVLVADDEVPTKARELADRMAGGAPLAVRAAKSFINGLVNTNHFGAVGGVVMLQGTHDAAEGIASFEERRPPNFEGR